MIVERTATTRGALSIRMSAHARIGAATPIRSGYSPILKE